MGTAKISEGRERGEMEPGGYPIYVAVDLETTGLDANLDTIIEVGAVKFQGQEVLGTFQTLVNPYRDLPPFIKKLTGIAQAEVDRAPPFAAIGAELEQFIGMYPVVGHNISFDLGFLRKHGTSIANDSLDTWELASILLPFNRDYSLAGLTREMVVENSRPHRALADAQATRKVFLRLLDRVATLEPGTTAAIGYVGARARQPFARIFQEVGPATVGNIRGTLSDLRQPKDDQPRSAPVATPDGAPELLDEEGLASLLDQKGAFSRLFEGYERRPQQLDMVRAVSRAFNEERHLVVEAGTGVGKSIGYLLPALVYAVRNRATVVVSTNTINLQEQLLNKDIPALISVLEQEGLIEAGTARAAPLKGRANYLCLQKLNSLSRAEGISPEHARLVSKCLVWLENTRQGDRAEINLAPQEATAWSHISAAEAGLCPGLKGEGQCFLRSARSRASTAHIVVVNHALLLSDLAVGGGLLPDHKHLIIDEAHRLEEEATRQLGFDLSEGALASCLESLLRNFREIRVVLALSQAGTTDRQRFEELMGGLETNWTGRAEGTWKNLWDASSKFVTQQSAGEQAMLQLAVTRSARTQPAWSDIEIAWENLDTVISDGLEQMDKLYRALDQVGVQAFERAEDWEDHQAKQRDLFARMDEMRMIKDQLAVFYAGPVDVDRVDWMTLSEEGAGPGGRKSNLSVQSAPLNVADHLSRGLFEQKSTVIMTSATLSTDGSFDYLRNRVGPAEASELRVGSPFDYARAAQMLIPQDMPLPDAPGYQGALESLLVELGLAVRGHCMVLFTSHAALRSTARAIREALESEGVGVLAQGIDGSPDRIVRNFELEPGSIILGTSSFWEGVDLPKGQMTTLVIARLPFHVPSDPIFAARSDQYEDSFKEYAVPQAILRLRQGMGRLIRNNDDRGSIIVLDRRLTARSYGKTFMDSLPPCTVVHSRLADTVRHARQWLDERSREV